jgi:hypothetical protein
MKKNHGSGRRVRVVRWVLLVCLGLIGAIAAKGRRPERQNGGISNGATNTAPETVAQSKRGMTGAVYAALAVAICLMVVGLSVIGVDLPQSLVSSLLLGVAVAFAVIGFAIWSSDSTAVGSRSNLASVFHEPCAETG